MSNLDLSRFELDDNDIKEIDFAQFSTVNLNFCQVFEFSKEKILFSLSTSKKLRKLNLMGFGVNHEHIKQVKNIILDTDINELSLQRNNLSDEDCGILSTCFSSKNCLLTSFIIGDNNFDFIGCKKLCNSMKQNKKLAHLDISDMNLSFQAHKELASLIRNNTTITNLRLCRISLSDDGCAVISKALRTNTSLAYLNLNSNKFSWKGVKELHSVFLKNTTLRKLSLHNNGIYFNSCFGCKYS